MYFQLIAQSTKFRHHASDEVYVTSIVSMGEGEGRLCLRSNHVRTSTRCIPGITFYRGLFRDGEARPAKLRWIPLGAIRAPICRPLNTVKCFLHAIPSSTRNRGRWPISSMRSSPLRTHARQIDLAAGYARSSAKVVYARRR